MLCRASSNFSFWPATTCSWVCGGGAAGVSRRFPVTTRVLGRRGGCARCSGLTTVMLGRLVVPPPAVCDVAVPPRPSSSDAELERRSVLLTKSVIVPILIKATAEAPSANSETACRLCATGRFQGARRSPRLARRSGVDRTTSGSGGSSGLESCARRFQMDELGVGGQVQKFDRLRQQQQRRCRKHHRARHRGDGTDRAGIARLVIAVAMGG